MAKKEELKAQILELTREYYKEVHAQKKEFEPGKSFVHYGGRFFNDEEMVNLVDSSLDFWLTQGPWTHKFERRLADWLGVKFCAVTNSGSSANLLAFYTLTSHKLGNRRIKKGDEVITVAAGFPTTVTPIIQFGAIPVFVDVALNLWLIEDNCDALGSEYTIDGVTKKTGTWGHIGTSSFYPPHHMTMGEGGAVYTNDPLLNKITLSFRDWGRDCWCASGVDNTCRMRFTGQFGELPQGYDHKYVYSHFGFNLKITDMQAAVGCAQLDKLDQIVAARRANYQMLYDGLKDVQGLILPVAEANSNPSWFGFLIAVKEDAGFTRNELTGYLEQNNIQTRNLFAGNLTKHPCFDEMRQTGEGYRIVGELKNTDFVMTNGFWVGVFPGMTKEMNQWMIKCIREFCIAHAK